MDTIGDGPTSGRPLSVSIFRCCRLHRAVLSEVFRFAEGFRHASRFLAYRSRARCASWRPSGQQKCPRSQVRHKEEESPASVTDALNLPAIVQPVSTTAGNSATTGDSCDNAVVERVQPAATRGSELMTPGPSLWCGHADRPMPSPAGPTTPRGRVAQISAISDARRHSGRLQGSQRHRTAFWPRVGG